MANNPSKKDLSKAGRKLASDSTSKKEKSKSGKVLQTGRGRR